VRCWCCCATSAPRMPWQCKRESVCEVCVSALLVLLCHICSTHAVAMQARECVCEVCVSALLVLLCHICSTHAVAMQARESVCEVCVSALLVWWMNVSAAMLLTARMQPLKEMKQCSLRTC
jgi:hypothetical protein